MRGSGSAMTLPGTLESLSVRRGLACVLRTGASLRVFLRDRAVPTHAAGFLRSASVDPAATRSRFVLVTCLDSRAHLLAGPSADSGVNRLSHRCPTAAVREVRDAPADLAAVARSTTGTCPA